MRGHDFERTQARGVIVDVGGDHEFIGLKFGDEVAQARVNGCGRTGDGAGQGLIDACLFER